MKRIFQLLLLCLFTTNMQAQIEYGCDSPSNSEIKLNYFNAESNDDIFSSPYDHITANGIGPFDYYYLQDTLDIIADSVYFDVATNIEEYTTRVWVDWNINGTYEDSEVVFTGQASGDKIEGAFTIPSSFTYGSITRVRFSINKSINQIDDCQESSTFEFELRNGGPRLTISSNSSGRPDLLAQCMEFSNPVSFEISNLSPFESYEISVDELSLVYPDNINYLTFNRTDLVIHSINEQNNQDLCPYCPTPYHSLFNNTYIINPGELLELELDITDYPIDLLEISQGDFKIVATVNESIWENKYKINCCSNVFESDEPILQSFNDIPFYTSAEHFLEIGNLTTVINENQIANYSAGRSIDFMPGFNTELGATVDAFISSCYDPFGRPSNMRNRSANEDVAHLETIIEKDQVLTSYPNPFDNYANIQYQLEAAVSVSIQLYNAQGRHIKTIVQNEWQEMGSHLSKINTKDLPLGLYICKLEIGDTIHSIKLLKTM